jgi:hypothetical protein
LGTRRYGYIGIMGTEYKMAGPIISGGSPRMEALFVIALISLLLVVMSPELASMVLRRLPWFAPLFGWIQHALNSK